MRNESDSLERNPDSGRVARPGNRPGNRPAPASAADGLWEVADVATYLRVPVNSIYKMTARKAAVRIPHIRLGGRLRFRRADVERWLTLLTVSNLEILAQMRKHASQVTHGHDSQAQAP
jgi:excisionase family DNA binding protein